MQNILLETRHGIPTPSPAVYPRHLAGDSHRYRSAANRLALALHIALFRHPGQGWLDGTHLPGALLVWLAEQLTAPVSALADYAMTRRETRSDHGRLAMRHLGPRPFVSRDDMAAAVPGVFRHRPSTTPWTKPKRAP